MALKTDYVNDKFEGSRRWTIVENDDGSVSLEDITEYAVNGDIFNADDINATNTQINTNTSTIAKNKTELTTQIATTKEELQKNIDTNHTANTQLIQVTLTASGWSSAAPYTQTVAVSGMTANDSPTPGIIYPSSLTETLKASIDKGTNMITKLTTGAGGITATCQFSKPTVDLIIGLKGV